MTISTLILLTITVVIISIILLKKSNKQNPKVKTHDDIKKNVTDKQNISIMNTYRIADTVDGISGRNSGDLVGDNSYISGEFCRRHPSQCDSGLLSEYTVIYDNTSNFGPYAYCNPGGIIGGTGEYMCSCQPHTLDKGDCINLPGQEQDRLSGGTWYSWPAGIECKNDEMIGDNGCKWKLIGEPVSVNIESLHKNG